MARLIKHKSLCAVRLKCAQVTLKQMGF